MTFVFPPKNFVCANTVFACLFILRARNSNEYLETAEEELEACEAIFKQYTFNIFTVTKHLKCQISPVNFCR